jgi:transketolase
MLNRNLNLSEKIFKKDIELKATRDGFGEGLVEAGEKDGRVVVLSADVDESVRAEAFKEKFPQRFIQVGVAEQVMAGVAAGMANYGKIPFICSYAVFSPGRNWEQIRTTVALNNVPVKIAGHHTGLLTGPDGATHQALEDIALMRVLPNMVVVVPCDALEARKATLEIAKNGKPSYIRLSREKTPLITSQDSPFKLGQAEIFWESKDPKVTIIACGHMVYQSLLAAKNLAKSNIESLVINCHTIKPIDEQTIIRAAKITGAVVTVEDHQITGGLGGAVAEVLAKNYPVPMEFVGVKDSFGESGKPKELLEKYGLTSEDIIKAVKKVIRRKNVRFMEEGDGR